MKSDLKNLASQQEIYYADEYSYTTNATSLGFVMSDGVMVGIGEGTGTGWSATATHSALAVTEGCAIYYGQAAAVTLGAAVPTAPGEMACTQ
jgi:hypothetical protein